jgi:hypothetical protein
MAYVLGTFSRLEAARSAIGKVKVVKTWRFCFVRLRPVRIDLRHYEGVTTGTAREADVWDWVVLAVLFAYGVIPALLWWYLAFDRDTYIVGLTRHHGGVALELYRGGDEKAMREIAQTARDLGGYPT